MEITDCLLPFKNSTSCLVGRVREGPTGTPYRICFEITLQDAISINNCNWKSHMQGVLKLPNQTDSICPLVILGGVSRLPVGSRVAKWGKKKKKKKKKILWRREWQPTPVFLPGESHGQRSLAGYSLWHDWTTKPSKVCLAYLFIYLFLLFHFVYNTRPYS